MLYVGYFRNLQILKVNVKERNSKEWNAPNPCIVLSFTARVVISVQLLDLFSQESYGYKKHDNYRSISFNSILCSIKKIQ